MDYIKTYFDCPLTIDGIYTVHYYEYAKDFAYSGEMHDFWELVYADKKNLYITAGSHELELASGQMYLHKPNEFHKIRCDGKRAANSVIISFDCNAPELFGVAGKVITLGEDERRLIGNIIKESRASFSTPLGNPYTSLIKKSNSGEFGCEQMIKLTLEKLLILLIRSNKGSEAVKINKNNSVLSEIIDYLAMNVQNRIVFDDIVKEFNLSPSVIKKLFRDYMGCGVMEYFNRLKVDAAKEMMREEKYNFTEIAEKLSFNNSQYFTTVFRRISGMTPTEYSNSVTSKSSR